MEKKLPQKYCQTLFEVKTIDPISELSNEILCVLVAQETAKFANVKVTVQEKNSAA